MIHRHNLFCDLSHVVEIVWSQRAGNPKVAVGPVADLLAAGVNHNPIGMRVMDILVDAVRIGAADNIHAEVAAALYHVAERIAIAEPFASVVHWNFGGIERDAASSAQASAVNVRAAKVIEPEFRIVVAGVVFNKGDLSPTHGAVVPARLWSCLRARSLRVPRG